MPSTLGIYIEDNLIKYAKVRKDKDSIKIEAFNVEFYEENKLAETLNKIVNETFSHKIPICINVSNELYNYYDIFSMLNKKDIKKSVDIEFEMVCNEKSYNKNSLETRFILMKSRENQEKFKVLQVAVNKSDINDKVRALSDCKIASMTPISTSITNLVEVGEKDNIVIINIENETKITTILEGQIYRVDVLEEGMEKILKQINKTENSMKKSYEVCKNVTIYTRETEGLDLDDNEHLEDVMPTLYKIVTESKKIIDSSLATISKVYITGLGTIINNVDLYFQEYMVNLKCEILKPFFIESSSVKIPSKEYIEVNSAVALALDGLGYLNKELDFAKGSIKNGGLNLNLDSKEILKKLTSGGKGMNFSLSGPLDLGERLMLRGCTASLILILGFLSYSNAISNMIDDKTKEVQEISTASSTELSKMDSDLSKINSRTNYFESQINSFNSLTETTEVVEQSRVIEKDSIPNMLSKLMFVIPQKVKVTSIKNTENSHIVIEAESEKYEQLGYFTSILKTENVLSNIKSTSGSKNGSVVKVTIEGDLP